jgi:hypothetical protein
MIRDSAGAPAKTLIDKAAIVIAGKTSANARARGVER